MYVDRFDQRSLAWALMGVAEPYLTDVDRVWLCVKIGAGELESALFTLVGRCMRDKVLLPDNVAASLRDWLSGYAGTEVAASFESYIARTTTDRTGAYRSMMTGSSNVTYGRFDGRPHRVNASSTQIIGSHQVSQSG